MNKFKKVVAGLLVTSLLMLVGCSPKEVTPSLNGGEVTVSFSTPDETWECNVPYGDNQTAYEATVSALDNSEVFYEKTGVAGMEYFTTIGDWKAGDHGPMSGWLYSVNDESPTVGCGQYTLSEGDYIQWSYYLDE